MNQRITPRQFASFIPKAGRAGEIGETKTGRPCQAKNHKISWHGLGVRHFWRKIP
jgi:hypothetical protein